MNNLQDKVVVITGAGSGIGRALAEAFIQEGCHLVLNDYKVESLAETIRKVANNTGQKVIQMPFDVANRDAMLHFSEKINAEFGRADIMINNAGVALGKVTGEDLPMEDFEWLMGINFWGMIYGSKYFLPLLKKQNEAALVNISSIFGLAGIPYQAAYCAAKFGIRGYTESLMQEAMLEYPHVTIHCVHPGGINTAISNNSRKSDKNISQTEHEKISQEFNKLLVTPASDMANYIVQCIKKKKQRIVYGENSGMIDFLTRFLPNRYKKILTGRIRREGMF